MDRNAQLSSPSGERYPVRRVSLDRVQPQRPPKSIQLRRPEWGPAAQASPWDGLAHPCAPLRTAVVAAGTGSALTRRSADGTVRTVRFFLRRGQERVAGRGGAPNMRRILAALAALASLFAVAGAGIKW